MTEISALELHNAQNFSLNFVQPQKESHFSSNSGLVRANLR